MMCVGLCGLHGAGKTHIAARLHNLGGWTILDKRLELKRLYVNGWLRRNKQESWEAWYRYTYERFGSGPLMLKVLDVLNISTASVVIVDAVHTPEEWKFLQGYAPKSILVGVCAPLTIREIRRDEPAEMDIRRARFWHTDGVCLMSMAEWALPGSLPHDLLDCLCQELITYVSNSY